MTAGYFVSSLTDVIVVVVFAASVSETQRRAAVSYFRYRNVKIKASVYKHGRHFTEYKKYYKIRIDSLQGSLCFEYMIGGLD